jgi:ATP-dependent Clp protease ATP-binding subunit ClpC
MDILNRFSAHLKEILARAMQMATELKNSEVEPLHLFFAITAEKGSLASEVVNRLKPNLELLQATIASLPINNEFLQIEQKNNTAEIQLPPLSSASKSILEKALIIAQKNNHNFLGSEHLLGALLDCEDDKLNDFFAKSNFKKEQALKELETMYFSASQFPNLSEMAEAAENIQDNMLGSSMPGLPRPMSRGKKQETALEYFAVNLCEPESQKKIDPLIGREAEVERLIQILSRRTKNNPVLLGDPGVGKTAIVEGLAKKITENKVPDKLRGKKIYSVDIGLLIAGTIYRGEFEARLKELVDEVINDENIILFIDEMHNIVGAGSNQGTMDAANLLKPALARGEIRCIGSTTPAEFKKFIESDAALERRFMPIIVREPSTAETEKILKGIKKKYEQFHQIKINDSAIKAAVELSNRYISGKFLPDKAIDILDETAAAARLLASVTPEENLLYELRHQLRLIKTEKEKAALNDRFGDALKLKEDEQKLILEIKKLESRVVKEKEKFYGEIFANDIAEQIAKITGNEPSEIIATNNNKFHKITEQLKKAVIGQNEPIDDAVALIRRAELGLSNPNRPHASLLFVGASGVGKTELAKAIAKTVYPNQDALIRLNMSEFGEAFGASKLLGSPAGYVGYKEANQFTDRLKLQPFSVVLFDEIDKAHPDILKLLLQMLEEGEITDATGKKISLKHAIIILTTSFGFDEFKKGSFGFSQSKISTAENRERLIEKLKEKFSQELINRLDKICVFNELTADDLIKIATLEINALNEQLKKYTTKISPEKQVIKKLISALEEKNINARDVRQKIRAEIEKIMADIILKGQPKKTYSMSASADNKIILK